MSPAPPSAAEITRASRSNLALSFIALPRPVRADITTFYAWCRVIDDLADDPGPSVDERRTALEVWRRAVCEPVPGEPALAAPVRELIARHRLAVADFHEIIAGMEMDLDRAAFETWDDLRLYCHRVASVVGVVSAQIFGARDPAVRQYALDLGLALQLTNILRDVGEDFANGGRVYLPRSEMARFGYSAADLAARRHDDVFVSLMDFQAGRARGFFRAATAGLPAPERKTMIAAEIMRAIYARLLEKMQRDRFHVFGHRYRLTRLHKLALVARELWRCR